MIYDISLEIVQWELSNIVGICLVVPKIIVNETYSCRDTS